MGETTRHGTPNKTFGIVRIIMRDGVDVSVLLYQLFGHDIRRERANRASQCEAATVSGVILWVFWRGSCSTPRWFYTRHTAALCCVDAAEVTNDRHEHAGIVSMFRPNSTYKSESDRHRVFGQSDYLTYGTRSSTGTNLHSPQHGSGLDERPPR